jgi:hypothetical protein
MTIPAAPREAFPTVSTTIEGTWFVKTSQGVLTLSLDELDDAFQRGDVDASTKVFTSGMAAWDTLGRVAHLDGGDAVEVAPTDSVTHDETSEIVLKPLDASYSPPTNTGVFGTVGSAWASISSPEMSEPHEPAEGHTVVRRSTGIMPYPLRKAVGKVADAAANLRQAHPRLAVAGPWLFGAALSGLFVIALYQVGAANSEPPTKSATTSVRAIVSPEPPVEKPASTPTVTRSSLSALSPAKGSLAAHLAAGAGGLRSSDDVTVRPIELRPAPSAETDRPSPRAAAKAKKAGKKYKAQRKSKARKRRSASLD